MQFDLANQVLQFKGHDELSSSLNKINSLEVLNVLENYDSILQSHTSPSIVLRGVSATIQNLKDVVYTK